jgi:hypothetical protein
MLNIDSLNGNGSIFLDGSVVDSNKFGVGWTVVGSFYVDDGSNSVVCCVIQKNGRKVIVQEDSLSYPIS